MTKLIALYSRPENTADFDHHYFNEHTPLAAKMPGLRKMEVSRIVGAPGGEPRYYLQAELYFDDMAALSAAMKSDEGKAAARNLMGFAGKVVHMMFGEVQ